MTSDVDFIVNGTLVTTNGALFNRKAVIDALRNRILEKAA